LLRNKKNPSNADRARWGASAMTSFGNVTGQNAELQVDPETVLADLLADLMHWCDLQRTRSSLGEPLNFETAFGRARAHYADEHHGIEIR